MKELNRAVIAAMGFMVLAAQPAPAQFVCTTTSADVTCSNAGSSGTQSTTANGATQNATTTNSGTVTAAGPGVITTANGNIGNATTTNSGTITAGAGTAIQTITNANTGNATTTNSGTAFSASGGGLYTFANTNTGNATTTNSGTVTTNATGSFGINTTASGVGDLTTINSGTINARGAGTVGIFSAGTSNNASVTNSGMINAGSNGIDIVVSGNSTVTNSGTVNAGVNSAGILSQAGNGTSGNSIVTNSGTVSAFGPGSYGIFNTAAGGNATVSNSGTVSGSYGIYNSSGPTGTATAINSGTVNGGLYGIYNFGSATTSIVTANSGIVGFSLPNGVGIYSSGGNVTVTNSGTVTGAGSVGVEIVGTSATLVNSGVISNPGGTAVQLNGSSAVLTLLPRSFIVGGIQFLSNLTSVTVNVDAGNQNLTFNTLAGANVTGTVPFVVSGNRIVSVDPTGFGVTDRSLMDFTRAVSSTLGGRVSDAAATGGIGSNAAALGFAGYDDSASRFDDVFGKAMGYASVPSDAVVFKNPTVTAPDGTTVWARGFYGQRTQQADGVALRNVTNFYGGMIGADRLTAPDLRLGGFIGGGNIGTTIDLNAGNTKSDVVFVGGYGRKDYGPAFVDFALLGGYTANNSTRNINNNLAAGGLEAAFASFGGWFISPEIATGYRYDFAPGWSVTPAVRLRYLAAGYDGSTESGSTANLTVGSRTLQNTEERADATLTRTLVSDAGRLQIGLTGGVLGQQRTGDNTVNAILLGQALAFATPGKSSIGGAYASTSLDWRMQRGLSLFAAAEYVAMSDSSNTVTAKAGLRVGF